MNLLRMWTYEGYRPSSAIFAIAPLIDKWGIQKKWLQILKFSSNQNYYNHWVTHKVNCKLLNSYRPSLLGIFAFASLIDRGGHTEATIWPLPHTHRQTSHTTLHQYTTKTLQKLCIEATDQIMPWHDFRPCVTNQTRYLPVPVRQHLKPASTWVKCPVTTLLGAYISFYWTLALTGWMWHCFFV